MRGSSRADGRLALAAFVLAGLLWSPPGALAQPWRDACQRLVAEIAEDYRLTAAETGMSRLDPRVAEAMCRVPRHEFVPPPRRDRAWLNRPLPIGYGQTISQPFIVALMTQLAEVESGDRVLEVGTGSGYQAAVLAALGAEVYSIEIIEPLATSARERLARLGFERVHVRLGDGYYGWPEAAPFDAIVVTAAIDHIPPPLVRQLAPGGRMVIPVGPPLMRQYLVVVEKTAEGHVRTRQLLPVQFVPFTGGHRR